MKAIRIVFLAGVLTLGMSAGAAAQSSPPASSCAPGGPANPPPTTQSQYPPASECAAPQASRTTAAPGEPITVTGQCPVATGNPTPVSFQLQPGNVDLGTVNSGSDGRYSHTFTLPAGTQPGSYSIVITCTEVLGEGRTRTLPVTVVAAAAAARTGTLPRTGESPVPLALGGATLVALGAGAVIATRRRRSPVS